MIIFVKETKVEVKSFWLPEIWWIESNIVKHMKHMISSDVFLNHSNLLLKIYDSLVGASVDNDQNFKREAKYLDVIQII